MVPVAQRLHRRFHDVVGRAEIGLADAEIDDVATLRRERIGARQDRKGILLSDAVEGSNGFQHGTTTRLHHALRTIAGTNCLIDGAPTCCIMA